MRFFLTSYQKSGTHQVYPMFMPNCPSVEDKSGWIHNGMDEWGFVHPLPREERFKTCAQLETFASRAFGHIPYLPDYAEAVQTKPTKVLFNIRDPRDVVVSEWENILTFKKKGALGHAWLNYKRASDGKRIDELDDPLSEIIKIDAIKWLNWIGWLNHDYVTVVRYENLRLHADKTIDIILEKFKGCNMPSKEEMLKKKKPGSVTPSFRKGLVGEWRKYFEPHHVELANEKLGYVMDLFGYKYGRNDE